MSVPRKILGAVLGVVAMATLVGVVLPATASPASAEPQCRWEIDPPPECEPPPPIRPVVPPPMGPMEPAPTMTPQPGGPTPQQPNETCAKAESRSTIVIRESGLPDKPVYTLIVDFSYCYTDNDGDGINEGTVTSATVTSRPVRSIPGDTRLRTLTSSRTFATNIPGGQRFLNAQEVFFTGCGDLMNIASCRNYRHVVQVGVTGNGTLSASATLELFNGPLPVII